mmetsp:Transcript_7717/g.28919  ORF Transcript_7717/g.28919 Transcript_7717/m.28919 type:complete len:105 (-) Transcript_7717:882-1196(-)
MVGQALWKWVGGSIFQDQSGIYHFQSRSTRFIDKLCVARFQLGDSFSFTSLCCVSLDRSIVMCESMLAKTNTFPLGCSAHQLDQCVGNSFQKSTRVKQMDWVNI